MSPTPDTPEYREFLAKRAEWLHWLVGDDPNSILRQIYRMIWNAAVFRVINAARLRAAPRDGGGVQLNGLVHQFMNDCFFDSQFSAIRRLLERQTSRGARSVYSLYRLVDEMQKNGHLLTREHILAAEGIEYDHKAVHRKWIEWERELFESGVRGGAVPREYDWEIPASRHDDLDRVTGVSEGCRSRTDVIQDHLLEALKNIHLRFDRIIAYTNKFVAHAASVESRGSWGTAGPVVTLEDIWEAHATICKAVNCITKNILDGSVHGVLPFADDRMLQYIDRPLVESSESFHLKEVWEEYQEETQEWTNANIEEFLDKP
ncbi:MAG: hypothetical protein ACYS8X_08975 [Planctomycetota bacterium]